MFFSRQISPTGRSGSTAVTPVVPIVATTQQGTYPAEISVIPSYSIHYTTLYEILQRPSWSSDGREVTVVTLTDKGEGVRSYRPTGKRWKIYVPESVTDIIQAELVNDTLFYLAQGDGSDNISYNFV